MFLNKVTITGADNSIQPKQLIDITDEFPFVEWGILFDSFKRLKPRFPTQSWIEDLFSLNLENISCHVCGSSIKKIANAENDFFLENIEFLDSFPRIQFNFSPYKINNDILELLKPYRNQFIFQLGSKYKKNKISLLKKGREMGLNLSVL